jgi:trans-aconitate 2-methyltransferase
LVDLDIQVQYKYGTGMTQADWNPDQYQRFADERAAPFWDLVSLVETDEVDHLVDLGCGDGKLTAEFGARINTTMAIGIDSSPAMLEKAHSIQRPGLSFERGDLAAWTSANDVDLVLANASLQWVPDHEDILRRWVAALRAGGQLAIQVPANGDHQSHVVADEVAQTEPFYSAMDRDPPTNPTTVNVLRPEEYATMLNELGFVNQHVRLQVYPHVLESSGEVVEWLRGTNLMRFFKRLPKEMHERFVAAYRMALLDSIGDREPYFYAFKRILMWGRLDR